MLDRYDKATVLKSKDLAPQTSIGMRYLLTVFRPVTAAEGRRFRNRFNWDLPCLQRIDRLQKLDEM